MPAGASQAALGTATRISRYAGTLRADRRILRAPRGLVMVRPQRGERSALPLSRMEIRRHRPMHGSPLGAGRERLLQAHQAEVLSAGRARWNPLDLYGRPAEAAVATRVRGGTGAAGTPLHREAAAGMQLAAGS